MSRTAKKLLIDETTATRDDGNSDATTTRMRGKKQQSDTSATALDRLIHERLRLGIISALAVNSSLTFNDLKSLLDTTDGNLSVHARKLEEADYVRCEKYFDGRTPKTEYSLTRKGRTALDRYLNHMEALIHRTRDG